MRDIPWKKRWPGKFCCKASLRAADKSQIDIETELSEPLFQAVSSVLLVSVCCIEPTKELLQLLGRVQEECKRILQEKPA